jgi:hypothetical protein
MPDVKAIEEAVKSLPAQDLAKFRAWFAEFDMSSWDRRISADLSSGKLDQLLAEAREDFRSEPRREV